MDFDSDAIGAVPTTFDAIIGNWLVEENEGSRVLALDAKGKASGRVSPDLAQQAKRLWGVRHNEFRTAVQRRHAFPLALWRSFPPPGDFAITVRFFTVGGRDDGAGIVFAVEADGRYQGVQASSARAVLEYFRVDDKGERSVLQTLRDVALPAQSWHTLRLELRGAELAVELDQDKRMDVALGTGHSGRVGLWAAKGCDVRYDDFKVSMLDAAGR